MCVYVRVQGRERDREREECVCVYIYVCLCPRNTERDEWINWFCQHKSLKVFTAFFIIKPFLFVELNLVNVVEQKANVSLKNLFCHAKDWDTLFAKAL